MPEYSFRVRLSDVSASRLAPVSAATTNDSYHQSPHAGNAAAVLLPFYRMDFDGKVVQSDPCGAAGDPSWDHRCAFEYRLVEDSFEQCLQSLQGRFAVFQLLLLDPQTGREKFVGSCAVDLLTLACGASRCVYDLKSTDLRHLTATSNANTAGNRTAVSNNGHSTGGCGGGDIVGQLEFSLSVEQQCVIAMEFEHLSISPMPCAAPYKLSYALKSTDGAHEVDSVVVSATKDPRWDASMLPRVLVRATLRAFLKDILVVTVRDVSQRSAPPIGRFELLMEEVVQSHHSHTAPFRRNAYAVTPTNGNGAVMNASAAAGGSNMGTRPSGSNGWGALVSGAIVFRDLPQLSPMDPANSSNINGRVHGKGLLKSCMLPATHSKYPSSLANTSRHSDRVFMENGAVPQSATMFHDRSVSDMQKLRAGPQGEGSAAAGHFLQSPTNRSNANANGMNNNTNTITANNNVVKRIDFGGGGGGGLYPGAGAGGQPGAGVGGDYSRQDGLNRSYNSAAANPAPPSYHGVQTAVEGSSRYVGGGGGGGMSPNHHNQYNTNSGAPHTTTPLQPHRPSYAAANPPAGGGGTGAAISVHHHHHYGGGAGAGAGAGSMPADMNSYNNMNSIQSQQQQSYTNNGASTSQYYPSHEMSGGAAAAGPTMMPSSVMMAGGGGGISAADISAATAAAASSAVDPLYRVHSRRAAATASANTSRYQSPVRTSSEAPPPLPPQPSVLIDTNRSAAAATSPFRSSNTTLQSRHTSPPRGQEGVAGGTDRSAFNASSMLLPGLPAIDPNPIATSSRSLLEQYQEAVAAVEAQLARIAAKEQQLTEQMAVEEAEGASALKVLERQVEANHADTARNRRLGEELSGELRSADEQVHRSKIDGTTAENAILNELDELTTVETELHAMIQRIRDNIDEDERAKRRVREDQENASARLSAAARAFSAIDARQAHVSASTQHAASVIQQRHHQHHHQDVASSSFISNHNSSMMAGPAGLESRHRSPHRGHSGSQASNMSVSIIGAAMTSTARPQPSTISPLRPSRPAESSVHHHHDATAVSSLSSLSHSRGAWMASASYADPLAVTCVAARGGGGSSFSASQRPSVISPKRPGRSADATVNGLAMTPYRSPISPSSLSVSNSRSNEISSSHRSPPRRTGPTTTIAPLAPAAPTASYDLRSLSPDRRGGANVNHNHSSSAAAASSASAEVAKARALQDTMRLDLKELSDAIEAGNASLFKALVAERPEILYASNSLLHAACAVPAPNAEIIHAILAIRPELVRGIDNGTGNNALHFVCAARTPSVRAVDALLTAAGGPAAGDPVGLSLVNALNKDGLTAFHVALLNLWDASAAADGDDDHNNNSSNREAHQSVRAFLLRRCGKSEVLGALTSRGETAAHLCAMHDRYLPAMKFLFLNGAPMDRTAVVMGGANAGVAVTPLEKAKLYGSATTNIQRYLEHTVGR